MINRIGLLLSRAKLILHEEGSLALFKRLLLFFKQSLFLYSSYNIYENTIDGPRMTCEVDDLTLRIITCPEEVDRLSGEGFCSSRLSRYKEAVNKRAILFCAFTGEDLVYSSLVFIRRHYEGCRDRFPFAIDYASTAWVGGDFTVPRYRRKGIHVYVQSKIFQYLREEGLRRAWSMQAKDNIAARNSAIKLGSYLYGEGYHLRFLSLVNFRWIKRKSRKKEV